MRECRITPLPRQGYFWGAGGGHGGVRVLNRDDPVVRAMALTGRKQMTFSLDMPVSDNDLV
jgi:UDP-N-acetylmuramoylalanine--D-glutamate ligase